MSTTLIREKCLSLDIDIYNLAMEAQWKKDKVKKGLSGDLHICKYCGRKRIICCICEPSLKDWDSFIKEIQEVSERDRSGEF